MRANRHTIIEKGRGRPIHIPDESLHSMRSYFYLTVKQTFLSLTHLLLLYLLVLAMGPQRPWCIPMHQVKRTHIFIEEADFTRVSQIVVVHQDGHLHTCHCRPYQFETSNGKEKMMRWVRVFMSPQKLWRARLWDAAIIVCTYPLDRSRINEKFPKGWLLGVVTKEADNCKILLWLLFFFVVSNALCV